MDPLATAEDNIVKRAADTRKIEQAVVDAFNAERAGPVQMRPAIVPGFYGRLNVGLPVKDLGRRTRVPVSLVSNSSFSHPAFVALSADEMRQAGQDLLRMARCIDEQEQGSAEGEQERPAELVSASGLPEGTRIVFPCGCQDIVGAQLEGLRVQSLCNSVPCQRRRI